jgi:hypothetical protein
LSPSGPTWGHQRAQPDLPGGLWDIRVDHHSRGCDASSRSRRVKRRPSITDDGGMRVDLRDKHWDEVVGGWLHGPDGRRYVQRTSRTKRKDADELLTAGTPLVLFYWAGQQLDWFDGAEAQEQWQAVRKQMVSTAPQPRGDIVWTAGRWEDEDGRPLLLLTGHC